MITRGLPTVCVLLCIASAACSDVRVIDADTLEISGKPFRIEGIDAPELGQKCKHRTRTSDWACGKEASQFVYALVEKSDRVWCNGLFKDEFDRAVAHCFADGENIGEALVHSRLA